MKRAAVLAVVAALALSLSACDDPTTPSHEDYVRGQRELNELAQLCQDGGGVYRYSSWNGYYCDYEVAE